MSYTVLARKFRSRNFDEVVGQQAICTTLKNAISQNRVHHGYLFTGTRGVGKTSMARILAKCLNCLSVESPTTTPCETCDSCVNIARGEDVDVVEIDAASNTGVDNIRELRNNAVFRPARSRFKIYIIDEVHMLSTGAFNALLKTLEEPPDHVKFILATTEVQKVPPTILSRVQRFDFRAISPGDIASQLRSICQAESVEADEEAVRRLSRLANGSMRDALSILDQALSMGGHRLGAEVVNDLFPATHDEQFAELIDKVAAEDAAGALAVVDATLSQGHTLDYWCARLSSQLRDLMILRVCGEQTDLVDVPAGLRPRLYAQSQQFDAGAFVYMISVLEELRRAVRSSGAGRGLVEAAVIRLAEASKFSSIESLLRRVEGDTPAGAPAKSPTIPAPSRAVSTPAVPAKAVTGPAAPAKRTRSSGVAPEQPVAMSRRVSQADLRAAHAEPAVKAALEVFGGRIVDVQRGAKPDFPLRGEPPPGAGDAGMSQ
jgi:DNA polymerase-3 subunit gamma/tau